MLVLLIYLDYTEPRTESLVQELLPTNGTEPEYKPLAWNIPPMSITHNCYDYAFNIYNPLKFDPSQIPGEYTCKNGISYLESVAKPTTRNAVCPVGTHKIALLMDDGKDFHFLRQDKDGTWSHKPGSGFATNKDYSGKIITDPETANMNNFFYKYKMCSYYCSTTIK